MTIHALEEAVKKTVKTVLNIWYLGDDFIPGTEFQGTSMITVV